VKADPAPVAKVAKPRTRTPKTSDSTADTGVGKASPKAGAKPKKSDVPPGKGQNQ
jgi:NADH-quinone oxidoreductase subunit C